MVAWPEPNTPVKITYSDGEYTRSLRGRFAGETEDGLFVAVVRKYGDQALVAKSRISAVTPIPEGAWEGERGVADTSPYGGRRR